MSQQNEEERVDASVETERKKPRPQTTAEVIGIEEELLDIEKQILSLYHTFVSPDYLDIPSLHNYVEKNNYNVYVHTLQDQKIHSLSTSSNIPRNPKVVAAAIDGIVDREEWAESLQDFDFSAEDIIDDAGLTDSHFPIGLGKSLIVHPDHQGNGIGFQMTSNVMASLRMNPPAVATVWGKEENNSHRKMESLIEKVGGEHVATYQNMFPENWRCKVCGLDNDCTCGCRVYIWGI